MIAIKGKNKKNIFICSVSSFALSYVQTNQFNLPNLEQEWKHIIARCRRGDHDAMCLAYGKMWKQIYPAVWQILRNREEAEDVLQESMIQGFDKLHSLKDDNKYPAWQKQIALRHALNKLKSRKSTSTLFEDVEVPEEDTGNTDWNVISDELIRKKIDDMPDGYRVVVRLHLLEGWSHDDIAGELGITASTSRSQYSRALSKLKKELTEEYERSN